jgi:hypothetical protein
VPILVTAFDNCKPFKIACGSYHNICLSYKPPKQEESISESSEENKILTTKSLNNNNLPQEEVKVSGFTGVHNDDECPHVETIKNLRGQIKRLRTELVLKGSSRRKN